MKKELTYLEKLIMIGEIKKYFESQLEKRLGLTKVGSPLFVKKSSGLQDSIYGKSEDLDLKCYQKTEILKSVIV